MTNRADFDTNLKQDIKTDLPDFACPDFLADHVKSIFAFYDPRVMTTDNGFRGCFFDNGQSFDPNVRQLVGSARYVVNYATAARLYDNSTYWTWAKHGLDFLTTAHKQDNGHYAWLIEDGKVTDTRVMAYGHAFVILAAAACIKAEIPKARDVLDDTFEFMENYFWDETASAYKDERDDTLSRLSPYRGQNANMHMCEGLLAAWEATGEDRYLARAEQLARRFTVDLTTQTGGMIWEHYDADWRADMTYNIDAPNDRYKPWGFQPGHQMEWAKLLLILNGARSNNQWRVKAQDLYERAFATGWDAEYGGLYYGVAPDGRICAPEKYFWVQSEAFATAWRLYQMTGDVKYRNDYNHIWQWCWVNMIDHQYGAWFRVRSRDGSRIDDKKSPLGKTDYHTLGACWDVLAVMEQTDIYEQKTP